MIGDTVHQGFLVLIRKKRLPAGSVGSQLIEMGFGAVFIVALLSFLLGITMGFQGVTQLQRFGAGVALSNPPPELWIACRRRKLEDVCSVESGRSRPLALHFRQRVQGGNVA